MNVAPLCPLPVGIMRWEAPAPALTLIVKMTLSLAEDEARLAAEQEPLSLDRPSTFGGEDELHCATDFVPGKARADLLLTGYAYADPPARVVPVRVGVGRHEKRFFALAGEEASAIPLVTSYLRADRYADAASVRVGARPTPHLDKLGERLDLTLFNAAPVDQQIDTVRSGSELVLEGLSPKAGLRRIQFPDERPRIYVRRARKLDEVKLRCDTLWIDTARAICTQTWRGSIPLLREVPEVITTLALPGEREDWADLLRRAAEVEHVRAVEVSDLRIQPAPAEPAAHRRVAVPTLTDRRGKPMALGFSQLGSARRSEPLPEEKTEVRPAPSSEKPRVVAASVPPEEATQVRTTPTIEPPRVVAPRPLPEEATQIRTTPTLESPRLKPAIVVPEEATQVRPAPVIEPPRATMASLDGERTATAFEIPIPARKGDALPFAPASANTAPPLPPANRPTAETMPAPFVLSDSRVLEGGRHRRAALHALGVDDGEDGWSPGAEAGGVARRDARHPAPPAGRSAHGGDDAGAVRPLGSRPGEDRRAALRAAGRGSGADRQSARGHPRDTVSSAGRSAHGADHAFRALRARVAEDGRRPAFRAGRRASGADRQSARGHPGSTLSPTGRPAHGGDDASALRAEGARRGAAVSGAGHVRSLSGAGDGRAPLQALC
ncbi:MAG: DUF2169 domain-containing protein [Minicystis sp.]